MNVPAGKNGLQRPPLGKVLVAQGVLLLLVAAAAWFLDGARARSILFGGLIFLLPQAWFSWRAFRVRGAVSAREVAQGFYRAEAGKFLLVATGFAVAFTAMGPVDAPWLLCAYVGMLLLNSVLLARSGAV